MSLLVTFARWGMYLVIGGFFGLVFWKLLAGNSLQGLLSGDYVDSTTGTVRTQNFTAGRAQSLVFVVYFSVYYLIQIIHTASGFPPIPKAMLYVFGGSQATYLSGKAYGLILGPILDDFKKGLSR